MANPSNSALLVTRSAYYRKHLKNLLETLKIQVLAEAMDGARAYLYYQFHKPALVVIDVLLKEKSGLLLAKAIIAKNAEARILLVSSLDTRKIREEALFSGASDLLIKPFSDTEFMSSVQYLIGDGK